MHGTIGQYVGAAIVALAGLFLCVIGHRRAKRRNTGKCAICRAPSDTYLCDKCSAGTVW